MKLLKKTNRTYFIISAIAFAVAGMVIYSVISIIFKEQLNEKLQSDLKSIIRTIETNNQIPNYYPFIEVRIVPGQIEQVNAIVDTVFFDVTEKENIPLRQISSIITIKGQSYLIIVRDTLLEKSDLLMSIGIVIGSVFILLIISLYLINRKLSIIIWKPFYRTIEHLKGFSHNDPYFRLPALTEIDEFIELNKTLETLTRKVTSDYQSLKRFTEDASHEIQTPLAVIQSKLESLMQYPDLKKDHAELIRSSYSSVQRISKLTQTLLLLTKIANDQFPEKKSVNLSELIVEKVKSFEDHINGRSLILHTDLEPACYIESNFFLTESLVINLLGNAIRHSAIGENIIIKLANKHLEISNTGTPLPVSSEKLFERFYKIDKSSDSHGLGLSIVKDICALNKWEINYIYEDSLHKFIVKF
jgi:signal transduction histidine kinase